MLEVFRQLGAAARRALWLSEQRAKREIENAARAAQRLRSLHK